jgi:hypothetical protein
MQTFFTSSDFNNPIIGLDPRRAFKQCVEAYQILLALTTPGYGWQHHPAVTMWRGYNRALAWYGRQCCAYTGRTYGYNVFGVLSNIAQIYDGPDRGEIPSWATSQFASNHRSILLGKAMEAAVKAEIDHAATPTRKTMARMATTRSVYDHYADLRWPEQPATRTADGKWPYLWPGGKA